jgi:hypothetical protein
VGAGREINIHFHVFEPSNFRALVELAAKRLGRAWTILDAQASFPEDCPNGILLVVGVQKVGGIARLRSRWHRLRWQRNPRSVVRWDARPLSAANEMRRTH